MIDFFAIIDGSKKLSPETKRVYKSHVRGWLDFAGTNPATWTGLVAQDYYNRLVDGGNTIASANTALAGVRYIFDRAQKLYPDFPAGPNPIDAVEKARGKRTTPQVPLTPERARSLLATCEEASGRPAIALRDRAMLLLAFYTGMRRSSLATVDLGHVFTPAEHPVVQLAVTLKGSAGDRYPVSIHPDVWASIESWRRLVWDGYGPGPLFRSVNEAGEIRGGLTVHGITYVLNQRAKAAGLRGFHPHLLRHTFIEWCRQDELEARDIAFVTGHQDSSTPTGMRAYDFRASAERAARVAARIREIVFKRLGV